MKLTEHDMADMAEYEFCRVLISMGYQCTRIGGVNRGFDVIAWRKGVRPFTVQVKWVSRPKHGLGYGIPNNNGGGKPYSMDAYDVLAVYLADRNDWVLFTRRELGSFTRTTWVPHEVRRRRRKSSASVADRTANNWEVLDEMKEAA